MNGDINEMLSKVLSDPEALNGVMKIARGMMNSNDEKSGERPPATEGVKTEGGEAPAFKLPALPAALSYDEDRVNLLKALRPYLGESRRRKVDYIISMMNVLKLLGQKGEG